MARIMNLAPLLVALLCCMLQLGGHNQSMVSAELMAAAGADIAVDGTENQYRYQGYKDKEDSAEEVHEDNEEDSDDTEAEDIDVGYDDEENDDGEDGVNQMERTAQKVLRQRTRVHKGEAQRSRALKSSGSGKGGKGSGSNSRSFLDPDIEPRPPINCIEPPDFVCALEGRSKGSKGSKGKGKGNRRRSRRNMSSSKRRDLRGKGKGDRNGRGARRGMMGGRDRLPYCPCPTESPTFFPTATPFPTFTPLPTVTPFPSVTPIPTTMDERTTAPTPTSGTVAPTGTPTISSAPSVSKAPSTAPSISNMPSVSKTPSLMPTLVMDGPTNRIVEARLGYGFFADTTVRQPRTEEINGLVVETNRFFTDVLRAEYPNTFVRFSMTNIEETFNNMAQSLPVLLDFDAAVTFSTNSVETPTAAEIFDVMDNANLQDYIQMYVWESEPRGTSIFFDTQRTSFGAKAQTLPT